MQDLIAEYQQYQEAGVDDLEEEYGEEQYAEDGQEVSVLISRSPFSDCVLTPSLFCSTPRSKRARCARGTWNRRETGGSKRADSRDSEIKKGDLQVPSIFPLLRSFCRAVCPSLSSSASSSSISSSFRPAPVSRYAVKSSLRGFFLLLSSSSLRPFRPPFRHTYLSAPAMSVPMRSTQRRLARDLSSPASHAAAFFGCCAMPPTVFRELQPEQACEDLTMSREPSLRVTLSSRESGLWKSRVGSTAASTVSPPPLGTSG